MTIESIKRILATVLLIVAFWFALTLIVADFPVSAHAILMAGEGTMWFTLWCVALLVILYCWDWLQRGDDL